MYTVHTMYRVHILSILYEHMLYYCLHCLHSLYITHRPHISPYILCDNIICVLYIYTHTSLPIHYIYTHREREGVADLLFSTLKMMVLVPSVLTGLYSNI